jgi:prevent-host-death family protein
MKTVGAYEAKTHLAQLLDQVQQGQTVTITRNGVPVAQLIPAPGARERTPEQVIDAMRTLRATLPSPLKPGETWRQLAHEGHRF